MQNSNYIGRFAPSPTGLLHLGSLIAAMASYCEAKKNHGQWLVRIEDVDPPREIIGASNRIIESLTNLGFKFKTPIIFQSNKLRQKAYQIALNKLIINGHTYNCSCSRKELKNTSIESHQCRNKSQDTKKPYNIKLKVENITTKFIDEIQGEYTKNMLHEIGDCILKRKDGLFSYQLAVVVDDDFQNITNIVRGIDLIDSTPWQILLNSLLSFKQVNYAHIPVLINSQGQKLSKQTFAKEIDNNAPLEMLVTAFNYLNQKPLIKQPKTVSEFWQLAHKNWEIDKLTNIKNILLT